MSWLNGNGRQAPIIFPLAAYGALGTAGPQPQLLNLARGLVMQIATHHRPDQVKIVALFPHAEAAQWEWLRWLPHVWTDDRQRRFLACYPDAAHNLLTGLYDLLVVRRETREAQQPTYLFLLADPSLIEGESILPLLLEEGSRLGAYPFFFSERFDSLPQGLRATAEVGPIISRLILSERPEPIEFSPDDVPAQTAVRFARLLAPIQPAAPTPAAGPHAEVTLLDVLGVDDVAALDVAGRWRASRPWKSLAAPLGRTPCSDLVSLDIHDTVQGPDGLVAGMDGARSQSLLRSLIASLAVHHHPHELALLLVDPGGEGLISPFYDLPHLAGAITDPVAAAGDRLLRTLESESRRRAEAFSAAGVDHHDAYLEKARTDESLAPLPHLLIIVNGSADLARDLMGLASTGRTPGMHLLIVLQEPTELIPASTEALYRFFLYPPADELPEGQKLVEGTTAAVATPPGRMILRVGPSTVSEPFEVAWSEAPCSAGGFAARDPHEILEVTLDGSRQPLRLSTTPLRIESAATQLEAVITHIVAVAEREAIEPLPSPLLS